MSSAALVPADPGPLSMMERISANISLYRPQPSSAAAATTPSDDDAAPRLICALTWMDAQSQHIAKYVTRYQALYPATPILLVRCWRYHFSKPHKAREEIQPAVAVIRAILEADAGGAGLSAASEAQDNDEHPSMLIHLFSNGGSTMLWHLYRAYREDAEGSRKSPPPSAYLPPHVTIFDSAPGLYSYSRGIIALQMGMTLWQRILRGPLIRFLLLVQWLAYVPWGRPDPFRRVFHNDHAVHPPGDTGEVRRAYVYSKEDRLVDWNAVERHAAEAERSGYRTRLELFAGTPHVAHSRGDEGRYWGIVRDIWDGWAEDSTESSS